MKKTVSLALLLSIFVCNTNVLAYQENGYDNNLNKIIMVAKALLATGIVIGTFARIKCAAAEVKKTDCPKKKLIGKTLIGVAGVCASMLSIINAGTNLGEIFESFAYTGDQGKVNQFCLGLNLVNICAALYTLRYIVSGQLFSDKNIKISVVD